MRGLIRAFTERDYGAIAALENRISPEYPETEENIRHCDLTREAKCHFERWVYEESGEIIAQAYCGNSEHSYHPRRFYLYVEVLQSARRAGIGTALYEKVMTEIGRRDPIQLESFTREDRQPAIDFLTSRGFKRAMREQESRLDLKTFAPETFRADLERVEREGIVIRSYRELWGDPDLHRKLYDLTMEVSADMPSTNEHTDRDFESYRERVFESSHLYPEVYMVALAGDEMIGVSSLNNPGDGVNLFTTITGVRSRARKRGIATALKVMSLRVAKQAKFAQVITWNEENNKGMLGINKRLGFRYSPAWITFQNVIDAKAVERINEEDTPENQQGSPQGDSGEMRR
ncbi:MAG: GNAT family N-acetyltransferase [bacterium]|nr:GNAT family N-acetyltransferase [bacterium]